MEILYLTIVMAILLVFLISGILNTRSKNSSQAENRLKELNNEITLKQSQLSNIIKQIENHTIDKTVALRNVEIKVLDIYDSSGIRIPNNILEDLVLMRLSDEKEILDYIENQRYYWKLECTKKPFKRG